MDSPFAEGVVDSAEAHGRVYKAAMRLLAVRERTEDELCRGLERRGHPPGIAREIVATFVEKGWVDDRRFAVLYIRHQVRFRPRSHRMLCQELKKKGCAAEIARSALEELLEEEPEVYVECVLAREVCRKKLRTGQPSREQILRYLAARGFSLDQAYEALQELSEGDS